jgi:osmoprotectant transport system ATP-binding protein
LVRVSEPAVEYRDVSVTAPNGGTILDRVSLTIARGERVAFLGRSGAGKTTALKLINGLVTPASGVVAVEGAALPDQDLVTLRRSTGYVMQHPALFPHRTVFENIATVPRLLGWDETRTRDAATGLLRQLELPLERFGDRYPRMLSGGEQQRVAIARAMIAAPKLLLCDEPFSALDPLIRSDLQSLFLEATRGTTLIFVTHDVREALRIAGRIVVFEGGRVIADATPEALAEHEHPVVRRFVASSA